MIAGMTQPPTPIAPGLFTRYLSLGFNRGEDPAKTRPIPVSHATNPTWTTIPWDVDYHDPDSMHFEPGGWTVLHGPCVFLLVANARYLGGQPGCSTHIELVRVDPDRQFVNHAYEAPEWFVGAKETSHTHLQGVWLGVLTDASKLQVRVNYWNATAPCRLAGATLTGVYGPLPT